MSTAQLLIFSVSTSAQRACLTKLQKDLPTRVFSFILSCIFPFIKLIKLCHYMCLIVYFDAPFYIVSFLKAAIILNLISIIFPTLVPVPDIQSIQDIYVEWRKGGIQGWVFVRRIEVGQEICASTLGNKVVESCRAGLESTCLLEANCLSLRCLLRFLTSKIGLIILTEGL